MDTMDILRGVVERTTYANGEKGFSVLKLKCKNYAELVTAVGNMASVNIGAVVTVKGKWSHHPKHGRQFSADSWEESVPSSIYGIEKYLGSGLIRGVGPKFARLIVNQFQEETIEIIENTPDRLLEVPKIGRKRVDMIKAAWHEQKEIKNIMLFLQEHNVSTAFGYRIYKAYGNDSIAVLRENPYKLADDIWGIGFKTADAIAQKLGMDKESWFRCRSAVFYILNQLSNEGHCYADFDLICKKCYELLDIEEPKIVMTLSDLVIQNEVIKEAPNDIYLPAFYHAERGCANRLHAIMRCANANVVRNFDESIEKLQKQFGIRYDAQQIHAIQTAVSGKVSILTGGAGTGKTTITKAIIAMFAAQGREVVLAAPTGRAAKRMNEASGVEAKTIHRLLGAKPTGGFEKGADNPISGDVLIVDESSMVDVMLMYALLRAVPNEMTVIFIGDSHQLPSVGAGNVLADMIASGVLPVVKLEQVFRQAQASQIIQNAHRINQGKMPWLHTKKHSDFFFQEEGAEAEKLASEIVNLCAKRLPSYFKANPIDDIQVLTPMRRGESGAANLNILLQQALNPGKPYLKRGATEYRLGDKVMQIKNNYEKDVFNGDIGKVCKIDTENQTLSIDFDGHIVEYGILELDELSLAYAMTIHKSQGSEFPCLSPLSITPCCNGICSIRALRERKRPLC